MKVLKYKEINRNSLRGTFDLKIDKWGGFIIRDMSFFQKGNNRWISFPSRPYDKDGEKKYYNLNLFENPETMREFQSKALQSLDQYLATAPEFSQPEAGIPF